MNKSSQLLDKNTKHLGFTLIECLVALFIVATVLASATRAISMATNDVKVSYMRQVAMWIAKNKLNDYQFHNFYPDSSFISENVNMANMDFTTNISIKDTPNPAFKKIEIKVSEVGSKDHYLVKLVGFISRY